MKNWKLAGLASILVLMLVCTGTPEAQVELCWTAAGDDGPYGTATGYTLAYSLDSLALSAADNGKLGWQPVTHVMIVPASSLPTPGPSGTEESYTVAGLMGDTVYYFAIKIFDEMGNHSDAGAFLVHRTPDITPPAAVILRLCP